MADDHPVVRAGIVSLLESDPEMTVIGEAENGVEAMQLVEKLRPNVLLLDLKMPGPRPAEIEKWVRTNYPEIVTLVLTNHDRDVYLAEMTKAGVSGYFPKSTRAEELIKAIHRAVKGEILFTEEQQLRIKHWQETDGRKHEMLTEREREILFLMCQGLDNASMAEKLGIKHRTVAFHVTNLLKKLEVDSRQQAVTWAYQQYGEDLGLGEE